MIRPYLNFICAALLALGFVSCGEDEKLNSDTKESSPNKEAEIQIPMTRDNILKGMEIYRNTCSPCHGSDGKGSGPASAVFNPKPRDHTNGAYMDKLTNAHLFKVVRYGGQMFGYPTMPAQPNLSDDQIKQVVAYVRTLSDTYKPQPE
jgi:mono/diheme cytochrome c family protein